MNPDTRMTVSLVLSLVVSAPNLRLAASGQADIVDVGIRYVVAFVLAFVVVGVVGRVFHDYVSGLEPDEDEEAEAEPVMPTPNGPITPTAGDPDAVAVGDE